MDMKAALVCQIVAMEALRDSGVPLTGTLAMAAVSDHMGDQLGSIAYFDSYPADLAVLGELSDNEIFLGHRGRAYFDITVLGKWAHMLGFRGHFATKSRRYSITMRALRRARRRAQALIAESRASGRPLDLAALEADLLADDEDETTLVIGEWTYAGSGWPSEAQRVLANAAAARAREYDQWKAEHKARPTREKGNGDG